MNPAKGVVFKRGDTWFHEVYDRSGRAVIMDNTGNWRVIFDTCVKDVYAVRRIERAGHKLQHSYPELVNMAAGA
jgi:hypothetical protein